MASTVFELCAMGCAIAGTFILAGTGPALLVSAPCLLLIGIALERGKRTRTAHPRLRRRKTRAS